MNNSLINDFLREFAEAKRELNIGNETIAEIWETTAQCVSEWENGIVDIRYVGALRIAVGNLYLDVNAEQIDKEIEESKRSTRKFLGLTGDAEFRGGKLIVKPFPRSEAGD